MVEDGIELVRGHRYDDALTAVKVGERLQLVHHIGAGDERGGHDGTGAGRGIRCRADRHEHQGGGAVQGHARNATRTFDGEAAAAYRGMPWVGHQLSTPGARTTAPSPFPSDREDTTMTSTTDTSTNTNTSEQRKVACLVAPEGNEHVELTGPWEAVEKSGSTPVLISTQDGTVQAFNHLDKGDTFDVDVTVASADVADYAALVLPGGVANPDALRTDDDAVAFVRQFVQSGKPVAAICHAPWTLIEADVVRGRSVTSWPSLQTDLRNAGATWEDREVVVDDNLITSRNPDDIPAFTRELTAALAASVTA